MNQLLRGVHTRVLLVVMLSVLVGLAGLSAMPSASAAQTEGKISGTVTNDLGVPLKGVSVSALQFDPDAGSWVSRGGATTKKNGTYVVKDLDPGTYQLFFSAADTYAHEYWDDHADVEEADDVDVTAGQTVTGIDAALAPNGKISGAVTNEAGTPLEGIEVSTYTYNAVGEFWELWSGTTTAADGSYLIAGARPDTYKVEFLDPAGDYLREYYDDEPSIEEGDDVTVTSRQTTEDIDAALGAAGHLTGTVTDSEGQGLADITVWVWQQVGGDWEPAVGEFQYGTGDDGSYDVGGLRPGTYRLQFHDPSGGTYLGEYYDDATDFEEATDIALSGGATVTGLDAELTTASHVQGTVTDEDGDPLQFVSVLVWQPAADGHWEIQGDVETDADGHYSIDGIPAGTYRVGFQTDGQHVDEFYDDVSTIEEADDTVVGPGATVTGIDAELALAAHITGTVTGPGGVPFNIVAVTAWRFDGTQWEDVSTGFADEDDDEATPPGYYDVGNLAPGTYRLEFDAFTQDHPGHEWWNDQPSLELAQDIVVRSKGQVLEGYDATLQAGQYPSQVENLTPPTITGSPVVGQQLTASPGTWNLAATTFRYQWLAGGAPVGADAPTYSPAATDVGKTITVRVVGSVAGLGSGTAVSAPTAAVTGVSVQPPPPPPATKHVVNLKRPSIKGTLEVGRKARVAAGLWNPADVTLSYKWFVGGKRILKADKRRLMLKEKWVGKRLTAKVIAKADGYVTARAVTQRSTKIKP